MLLSYALCTVYSLLAHVTSLIRIQISSDKYLKKTGLYVIKIDLSQPFSSRII